MRQRLYAFLTSPWGQAAGLAVSILSLVSAVYFYLASIQRPEPLFLIDPARTEIFNAATPDAGHIGITYRGRPLSDVRQISAVRVYFWNNGKAPIRKADVLDPLKITISPEAEFLDARILQVSRPVSGVGVDTSNLTGAPARLWFEVLEQGDGATIQLTYIGGPSVQIGATGSVVGAKEPRTVLPAREVWSRRSRGSTVRLFVLLALPVMGVGWLVGAVILALARWPRRAVIYQLVMLACMLTIGVISFVQSWKMFSLPSIPESIVPVAERAEHP